MGDTEKQNQPDPGHQSDPHQGQRDPGRPDKGNEKPGPDPGQKQDR